MGGRQGGKQMKGADRATCTSLTPPTLSHSLTPLPHTPRLGLLEEVRLGRGRKGTL